MRAGDSQFFQNIAATTTAFVLRGGLYGIDVAATFGGGSVELQKLAGDGSSWVTAVATPLSQLATVAADFDALASTGASDTLVALLNGQSYNAATKQLSGTPGASVTLTVAQQEGLIALANTLGAAIVSVPITFSAAGFMLVALPPGTYKFVIATATAAYIQLQRVPGE